jgi:hypothetical protein
MAAIGTSPQYVAIGFGLIARVYRENTFSSATIEVAKNQKVISTGPYAIVRHPMYASGSLYLFGTPLALGSNFIACLPHGNADSALCKHHCVVRHILSATPLAGQLVIVHGIVELSFDHPRNWNRV